MVLTSPALAALLFAASSFCGTAHAAPGQAGAVGVGVTHRLGTVTPARSHVMGWLRPADPVFFGVGVGHASTRDARSGVSLRLSAAIDITLAEPGDFEILLEGGGVSTLGAADGRLVSTLGPSVRLVFLSGGDPLSLGVGWAPELQPGSDPTLDASAAELSLRVWF